MESIKKWHARVNKYEMDLKKKYWLAPQLQDISLRSVYSAHSDIYVMGWILHEMVKFYVDVVKYIPCDKDKIDPT